MVRAALVLFLPLLVASAAVARAEKRIALVIGNQNYKGEIGPHANPHNDAAHCPKQRLALRAAPKGQTQRASLLILPPASVARRGIPTSSHRRGRAIIAVLQRAVPKLAVLGADCIDRD